MNIAIIGAGFTGLAAGYYLSKSGHHVTIYEKDSKPGGLAVGFSRPEWDWTLEEHYHHWFANDLSVLNLAKEINYPVLLRRPKTSVLIANSSYQLDSPYHVLTFPELPVVDRVRMAGVLGILRYNPFWKPLERFHTHTALRKFMGNAAYQLLWEPQLKNKFGSYYQDISLAWFWARIKKRTPKLAYPEGGYLRFAEAITAEIKRRGGEVRFGVTVEEIKSRKKPSVKTAHSRSAKEYDAVIVTVPSPLFTRLAPDLPGNYVKDLKRIKGLGAMNLILRLKEQFMADGTYWLSICDHGSPVLAVVEHTNFMSKHHYNNEHLVYVGNYLSPEDKRYSMNAKEILGLYDGHLRKINRRYKKNIIGVELFKAPFAQPIIETNYSRLIPPLHTPLKGVYLANIQQVYPWDRGTNYSVELGKRAADAILSDTNY